MYTLPELLLEDVGFKLSAGGLPVLCDVKDAAFLTEFAIGISADADGEWEIISVRMGEQEFPASHMMSRLIVAHVAAEHTTYVQEHINEHFADAVDAEHSDYDKTRSSAQRYREVA